MPEHDDNRWTSFSVLGNHWTVATTPQMVQENACDIEHLRELHGFPEPSVVELHTDGPVLRSSFTHLRSYPEAGVEQRIAVSTSIDIFGLGLSKQTSTAFGDIRSTSLCTTTPIDEARVDLRMASAVQRLGDDEITAAVHKTVLDTTRATIEEDIPLWETRDYGVVAPFTRDRGIVLFRRWAAQFYETAGDVVSEPNGIDAGAAVAGIGWR